MNKRFLAQIIGASIAFTPLFHASSQNQDDTAASAGSSAAPNASAAIVPGSPATNVIIVPPSGTNSVLSALPAQAAEVVRLSQAGVSEDIILSFIEQKSDAAAPLTADQVLVLKNMGISPRVLRALLERQNPQNVAEGATTNAQPTLAGAPDYSQGYPQAPGYVPPLADAAAAAGVGAAGYETLPQDYAYYQETLAPYGTWSQVPTYGWCWQPTVCSGHPEWRPYCDNGHWTWTDCGWYWNSSYPWGWAAFHYGRWLRHERFGWLWQPARAWAPAWVCWREAPSFCGWAPLPPEARYILGTGWTFKGRRVDVQFDFGLPALVFNFVPLAQLCDLHPAARILTGPQAQQVFASSTVFVNITVDVNKRVINPGIQANKVEQAAHITLRPLAVESLPANQRPPTLAGEKREMIPPPTGRPQSPTVPRSAPAATNGVPPAPTLPRAPTLPPAQTLPKQQQEQKRPEEQPQSLRLRPEQIYPMTI